MPEVGLGAWGILQKSCGFHRFYGFLDAKTDHYAPGLVWDNTRITALVSFCSVYRLSADLIDQALAFIRSHEAALPEVPWLTWIGFGACHAPHQAPRELVAIYTPSGDGIAVASMNTDNIFALLMVP